MSDKMVTKTAGIPEDIEKSITELYNLSGLERQFADESDNLSNVASQLRGKMGDHDVYNGMQHINTALFGNRSDPQFRILHNQNFSKSVAPEEGLEMLHKGFLDHDLPFKVGNELRTTSSVFDRMSLLYEGAESWFVAPIYTLDKNKAERTYYERMRRMMKSISKGFELVGNISFIKEKGNGDASESAMLLLRKGSINALSWARVHYSNDAYAKYKVLSGTKEFRDMSDENKFGILLNGNEPNHGF